MARHTGGAQNRVDTERVRCAVPDLPSCTFNQVAFPGDPLASLEPQPVPAEPLAPPAVEAPAWGLLDVLFIAIFNVIAGAIFTGVGIGIVHFVPSLHRLGLTRLFQEPLFLLPPQTLSYIATLCFMFLVVRRGTERRFWDAVKWRWPQSAFYLFLLGLGLSILVQAGSAFLPIPKSLPIDQFFKTTRSAWLLAIFGTIVAPFFEELFFRGFFYPALYRHLGFAGALVINSAIFALFHEGQLAHAWAPLTVLFIVGMALTLVRAKTQSVACSFLVHSAYNTFLFASIFVVTGGFRHMDKLGG
jgi:membrane protease YdiL (CAAX protease family)